MRQVSPLGPVYQAGTLSGNPLAMRAGLETLRVLAGPGFYDDLNRKAARLIEGFRSALDDTSAAGQVTSVGSLLTIFFTKQRVRDYSGAKKSDTRRFASFFVEMADRGIFLPPSQFEALFVSSAHSEDDIDRTVAACRESLKAILATAPAI